MVLVSLFGKTQAYSSREVAEETLAKWLADKEVNLMKSSSMHDAFLSAFSRHDYRICILLWNEMALARFPYKPQLDLYSVKIEQCAIDAEFTTY